MAAAGYGGDTCGDEGGYRDGGHLVLGDDGADIALVRSPGEPHLPSNNGLGWAGLSENLSGGSKCRLQPLLTTLQYGINEAMKRCKELRTYALQALQGL